LTKSKCSKSMPVLLTDCCCNLQLNVTMGKKNKKAKSSAAETDSGMPRHVRREVLEIVNQLLDSEPLGSLMLLLLLRFTLLPLCLSSLTVSHLVDKTKVMACDGIACCILIPNEQLEQVDVCQYLGS